MADESIPVEWLLLASPEIGVYFMPESFPTG
jgi:hypothetical protein